MEKKVLVFTDRNLKGKKFLGMEIVTSNTLPDNLKELSSYISESVEDKDGYFVDTVWFKKLGKPYDMLDFKRHGNKSIDFNLNVTHEQSDSFYSSSNDSKSTPSKLVHMQLSAERSESDTIKHELRFCVSIQFPYIMPYLEIADLLYSEPEEKLTFFINYNYKGCIDDNDLTCEAIKVDAGNLVKSMESLYNSLDESSFETIELYRYVQEDQSELGKYYKPGSTEELHSSIAQLLGVSNLFGNK